VIGDDPLQCERDRQEDDQEELRVEQHYPSGAMRWNAPRLDT
jgi:hypothetical protein